MLLPTLVLVFGRNTRIFHGDPFVGTTLVRLIGFRRSRMVVGASIAIVVIAGVIVVRYVAADPFEYDIKRLRSEGADAVAARHWMKVSDDTFGRGYAGRTFIAADRPHEVPMIIAALQARNAGKRPEDQTIGWISSIFDIVPSDQPAKIAVLDQIRALLDDDALAALDDKERAELARAPGRPRTSREITVAAAATLDCSRIGPRSPRPTADIGLMISIHAAPKLDEWNGHDLMRFANAVRRLDLSNGETITTSGASVIFADIIRI